MRNEKLVVEGIGEQGRRRGVERERVVGVTEILLIVKEINTKQMKIVLKQK